MKYSLITLCFLLISCSESTNPSGILTLNGEWNEDYLWHSTSSYIYPKDSTMWKHSKITFSGNTFTLNITPAHRLFTSLDSTSVLILSDTIYTGTYSINDSIINFRTTFGSIVGSIDFIYRLQSDSLYLTQKPFLYHNNQPEYQIYPILWAAASNKFSGVFSKAH